jgi:hypothetical protein
MPFQVNIRLQTCDTLSAIVYVFLGSMAMGGRLCMVAR